MSPDRRHWPEYLIEAWALGMFMVAAGAVTTALESRDSILHAWIADANVRRALIGLAMGVTAILLIYSPWGRRSGAHMNPAVTLAFFSLGKVAPRDALFYICAQIAGGILGVVAVRSMLGSAFTDPPVSYVVTVPGHAGAAVAFAAEFAISFVLFFTVLIVLSSTRWAKATGAVAGLLVAIYITVEAPLSGMSMNPARTLASAFPSANYSSLWIYLTAPVAAMCLAARVFAAFGDRRSSICAKLQPHSRIWRCIHCGHTPPSAGTDPIRREPAETLV